MKKLLGSAAAVLAAAALLLIPATTANAATGDYTVGLTANGTARASGYDIPLRAGVERNDIVINVASVTAGLSPRVKIDLNGVSASDITYSVRASGPNASAIAQANAVAATFDGKPLTTLQADANGVLGGTTPTVPPVPAGYSAAITLDALFTAPTTGSIGFQIVDANGNPLSAAETWNFTVTAPEIGCPTGGGTIGDLTAADVTPTVTDDGILPDDSAVAVDPSTATASYPGSAPSVSLADLTTYMNGLDTGDYTVDYSYTSPDDITSTVSCGFTVTDQSVDVTPTTPAATTPHLPVVSG